jgi:acyl-CoA thioester hydrolase
VTKPARTPRERYLWWCDLTTRWADNDVYGHVNNVQYHAFFDTAVNRQLIDAGLLAPAHSEVIGLVVETTCSYLAPVSFPDRLQVGLRVLHLGRSSVRYETALFRNDEALASAVGSFVHVYVDRISQRPVPLPEPIREALRALQAA